MVLVLLQIIITKYCKTSTFKQFMKYIRNNKYHNRQTVRVKGKALTFGCTARQLAGAPFSTFFKSLPSRLYFNNGSTSSSISAPLACKETQFLSGSFGYHFKYVLTMHRKKFPRSNYRMTSLISNKSRQTIAEANLEENLGDVFIKNYQHKPL